MVYNLKSLCVFFFVIRLVLRLSLIDGSSIGVCYETQGHNFPSPRRVVNLYEMNDIKRMRIYEPNNSVLECLRKSNIEVLIGIRNSDISNIAKSYHYAKRWIETHIKHYWPDVRFRYIAVGNEAIPGEHAEFVLPAMENLHAALCEVGLERHIKISTAINSMSVLSVDSSRPSTATFSNDSIDYMRPIAQHLSKHGAPLLANVYPYFSYVMNTPNLSIHYPLFSSTSIVVWDGRFVYQNLFDVMLDALYVSLEKVGELNISVVVSETGWPSAGLSPIATRRHAWLYLLGVVKHVNSPFGSPRRLGRIETYIYVLFSETKKMTHNEREWGLFHLNMFPIFNVHFLSTYLA